MSFMYIILNVKSVKEIKILIFVSKKEFLKSDDVKSNHKNMMKINEEIKIFRLCQ